jgi:hypothetical protein
MFLIMGGDEMATIRRLGFKMKGKKLTETQKADLLYSVYSHFDFWPKDSPFRDTDDRRRTWFEHRDGLMALLGPGTRPGGWWDYEAKEKHRPIGTIPLDKPMVCYHTGNTVFHHVIFEKDSDVLKRMGVNE